MRKNVAIIFAGGVGKRMGSAQTPKQFIEIEGKPIIIHTLDYFENHDEIDEIFIACIPSKISHLTGIIDRFGIKKVSSIVEGGKTAQDSIYNALLTARKTCGGDSIVLIHDGVRPFISASLISDVISCAKKKGNAVTCMPCFETIIISEDTNCVETVPLRKNTYVAQAPQAFNLDDIISAHKIVKETNPSYEQVVDSCTMFRLLGKKVFMVRGNMGNIKITKPEDVYILEGLMKFRRCENR
jgi:2-C-methyl-D-erythritol 4-phosphate cytidylyltransferase